MVEHALRLLLRPAQRFRTMRAPFNSSISRDRLQVLASGWETRDFGLDYVELGSVDTAIGPEASRLKFQFYRPSGTTSAAATAASTTAEDSAAGPRGATLTSPRSTRANNSSSSSNNSSANSSPLEEGLVTISLGNVSELGKSNRDIFLDLVQKYHVPEDSQFSLYHHIRIANGIRSSALRRHLLVIKLLAVSVLSLNISDDLANNTIFLYEPTMVKDLANLLHFSPDREIDWDVRTAALYALNALAHLRSRLQEVLTALNAAANHGVLTYIFRRVLAWMDAEHGKALTCVCSPLT